MNPTTSAIDFDEAHTFCNALGGPSHVFQVLPEREDSPIHPCILEGDLDTHKQTLSKMNARGAGIFVTVNEAIGGRKKQNIRSVRALFIDLDGAPVEPVLEATPNPDMVIETSSGRFHAYWLTSHIPLDRFESCQRRLIERFDADSAVKDLSRTMRLPGFFHQKRDPFFVKIIHINEGLSGYA